MKELALITRLLSALRDPVALDIGGNLGGHALTMAQVAKTVHVVEPFPPLAERIEQLLALNAKHNVSVHRVGLGAEQAELAYYLETESRNQGTGSFLPDHTEGGEVAKLPVVRGDDYFAAVLEALDFVKIDVEGFEAPALAGLRQTLSRFEPFILMEVTESSARLWERFGGLESVLPFEFTIWRVCNPRYPLGVFQAYSYSITPVETVPAEKASYNVLIVPASRADDFKRLRKARRGPG